MGEGRSSKGFDAKAQQVVPFEVQNLPSRIHEQMSVDLRDELEGRNEQVIVVPDKHPFLVGVDFIWPYIQAPLIGFMLLSLLLGIPRAWKATVGKYLKSRDSHGPT